MKFSQKENWKILSNAPLRPRGLFHEIIVLIFDNAKYGIKAIGETTLIFALNW